MDFDRIVRPIAWLKFVVVVVIVFDSGASERVGRPITITTTTTRKTEHGSQPIDAEGPLIVGPRSCPLFGVWTTLLPRRSLNTYRPKCAESGPDHGRALRPADTVRGRSSSLEQQRPKVGPDWRKYARKTLGNITGRIGRQARGSARRQIPCAIGPGDSGAAPGVQTPN